MTIIPDSYLQQIGQDIMEQKECNTPKQQQNIWRHVTTLQYNNNTKAIGI
jgi:hypothetical protein